MQLASIRLNDKPVWGRVEGDELVIPDKAYLHANPTLLDALARDGISMLGDVGESRRLPIAEARFDPVITAPGRIICVGINFRPHMEEMDRPPPEYPWLFVRWPSSVVGHGQPLLRPSVSHQYDYEGELAIVIGKPARHVKAADALDYVAGYTCFMDGSVRDWQRHGSQFTPGKNFESSGSIGPWLVTADEIPDPSVLELRDQAEWRAHAAVADQRPVFRYTRPDRILLDVCRVAARRRYQYGHAGRRWLRSATTGLA